MTLGELIDALRRLGESDRIRYDFGYMTPTEPASYRGFYDHLAFGYENGTELTVGRVLSWATAALDATYAGYKGGLYTMRRTTLLWVANWSEVTCTAIIGVRDLGYGYVIIETAYVDV